jgi:hypothetical protein
VVFSKGEFGGLPGGVRGENEWAQAIAAAGRIESIWQIQSPLADELRRPPEPPNVRQAGIPNEPNPIIEHQLAPERVPDGIAGILNPAMVNTLIISRIGAYFGDAEK